MTRAFLGGYFAELEDVYHTEEDCPAGRLDPSRVADGRQLGRPNLVSVVPCLGGRSAWQDEARRSGLSHPQGGTDAFFFASATSELARVSASFTIPAALASVSLRSWSAASFAAACARGFWLLATSESACR